MAGKLEGMSEFFSRRVDTYDEHMRTDVEDSVQYYPATTQALCGLKPNARLLDLGAGTGLELEGILAAAPETRVTCVDMCADMLARLRAKFPDAPELTTLCADYFAVDLGQAQFDAAVAVETLHHFTYERKVELYSRIRRALKSGAPFIDTDYMAADEHAERSFFEELARLKREQGLGDSLVHFDTPLTSEHEMAALREAGFARVELLLRLPSTAVIRAWAK